jgi:negative regulator of genetic competence, sporulation and motility
MSIKNLLEKTTCVLLDSATIDDAIVHSVGLTIEMKVPGFYPIENEFHVHLDLSKSKDNKIILENMTPQQMLGYKFWCWLETSSPEGFLSTYVSSIFDQAQQQSIKKFMH